MAVVCSPTFTRMNVTCSLLPVDSILYVTCVNKAPYLWQLASCPAIAINLYEAHIALANELGNRRVVFFMEDSVQSLVSRCSPVWLQVKSSCEIKMFNPDEDEEEPYHAVLVSNFSEIPGVAGPIFSLSVPANCKPYEMPPVTKEYTCNCVNCPTGGMLFISSEVEESAVAEVDAKLQDMQINSTEDSFTKTMTIKGSTWDEKYQATLKDIRKTLVGGPVCVRLVAEKDNPVDCNALKVMHQDNVLGYIGAENIPRVTKAISDPSLKCFVTSVTSYFFKDTRFFRGYLSITKCTSWDPLSSNYVYNQNL